MTEPSSPETGADPGRPGPADEAPDPRSGLAAGPEGVAAGRNRPVPALSGLHPVLPPEGAEPHRGARGTPGRAVHPLLAAAAGPAGPGRLHRRPRRARPGPGGASKGTGGKALRRSRARRRRPAHVLRGLRSGGRRLVAHEVRDEVVHRGRIEPRRIRKQRFDAAALLFREDGRQRAAKLLDQHRVALCAPAAMADRRVDVDALRARAVL